MTPRRTPASSLARAISGTAVLIAAAALPVHAQDGAGMKSTRDGVFSQVQARRGEAGFRQNCAECHSASDFTSATVQRNWAGRTVFDLFEQIRTTMPNTNPGGLQRQLYLDIIAYLFRQNGFPAGDAALTPDEENLKRIRIGTAASRDATAQTRPSDHTLRSRLARTVRARSSGP
jgi:mono/diheme cytochrome c family protein